MTTRRGVCALACLGASILGALVAALGSCSEPSLAPTGEAGVEDARGDRATPFTDVEDITCVSCRPQDASGVVVPAVFAGRSNPRAGDAAAIARGRSFFGARCALCQGPDGDGRGLEGPVDPPAADLTVGGRADDYLLWRITEGGREPPFCSGMPSYRALTETERWELVAYVRTLAASVATDAGDAGD